MSKSVKAQCFTKHRKWERIGTRHVAWCWDVSPDSVYNQFSLHDLAKVTLGGACTRGPECAAHVYDAWEVQTADLRGFLHCQGKSAVWLWSPGRYSLKPEHLAFCKSVFDSYISWEINVFYGSTTESVSPLIHQLELLQQMQWSFLNCYSRT